MFLFSKEKQYDNDNIPNKETNKLIILKIQIHAGIFNLYSAYQLASATLS